MARTQLYSEFVADRLLDGLSRDRNASHSKTLDGIAKERDKLLARSDKVIVFLFTTLCLIAIALYESSEKADFELFGFKFSDKRDFIFAGLMVGNVLFVASTGLFFKIITCEYFLLRIVTSAKFDGNSLLSAFTVVYPANTFAFARIFGLNDPLSKFTKIYLRVTSIYARYVLITLYGIFYYAVLFTFLWNLHIIGYWLHPCFLVLTSFNIFSTIAFGAIFYRLRASSANNQAQQESSPES